MLSKQDEQRAMVLGQVAVGRRGLPPLCTPVAGGALARSGFSSPDGNRYLPTPVLYRLWVTATSVILLRGGPAHRIERSWRRLSLRNPRGFSLMIARQRPAILRSCGSSVFPRRGCSHHLPFKAGGATRTDGLNDRAGGYSRDELVALGAP